VLRRGPFPGPPVPVAVAVGAILAAVLAMNAVVFACARSFRASGAQEGRARRAFAAVAVAFDVYVLFAVAAVLAPGWNGSTVPFAAGTGLLVVLTVGAAVAFVPGRATHDARLASRLVATFAASAVAGGVFWLVPGGEGREFGAFGIVRTIGAALLVLAIVRYDLLGVPLPRLAVSRGPLAAGALAILFVVAQVAQNFLAAQYGLLMGGVVAGAFLFAASPIQRAFEGGRRDRAVAAAAVPDDAALEAYRAAVRAALADGAMTREEEEHLADVAHHLKLSPRDALRVRREVEDARTRSSL
ncbi:MAG TPA: hypothetical protein VI997_00625, partial [Candidatus Thermoplasmatota archaeon]|nr:hypothetical protein [Candidatus Thermoplasmatota archaeon]